MNGFTEYKCNDREDAYFARLPVSIIESWYKREGYIKSMADLIEKGLLGFSNPEEVILLLIFTYSGDDDGDP